MPGRQQWAASAERAYSERSPEETQYPNGESTPSVQVSWLWLLRSCRDSGQPRCDRGCDRFLARVWTPSAFLPWRDHPFRPGGPRVHERVPRRRCPPKCRGDAAFPSAEETLLSRVPRKRCPPERVAPRPRLKPQKVPSHRPGPRLKPQKVPSHHRVALGWRSSESSREWYTFSTAVWRADTAHGRRLEANETSPVEGIRGARPSTV